MSMTENEKIVCPKCKGKGHLGKIRIKNRNFYILCHKCLGHKRIDWILNIIGQKLEIPYDVFHHLHKNKKNIAFKFGGNMFFLVKEVKSEESVFANRISINVPLAVERPDIVDMAKL